MKKSLKVLVVAAILLVGFFARDAISPTKVEAADYFINVYVQRRDWSTPSEAIILMGKAKRGNFNSYTPGGYRQFIYDTSGNGEKTFIEVTYKLYGFLPVKSVLTYG